MSARKGFIGGQTPAQVQVLLGQGMTERTLAQRLGGYPPSSEPLCAAAQPDGVRAVAGLPGPPDRRDHQTSSAGAAAGSSRADIGRGGRALGGGRRRLSAWTAGHLAWAGW